MINLGIFASSVIPVSAGWDDEFSGASLGAAWSWLNQTGATATVSGGYLRLATSGSTANSCRLIIRDAPSGNYSVKAKLTHNGGASTQSGLLIYNPVTGLFYPLNVLSTGAIYVQTWTHPNVFNSNQANSTITPAVSNVYYLEIQRSGTTTYYRASGDGSTWTTIYTRASTSSDFNKVGLFINQPTVSGISGYADIDWIRAT